MALGQPPSSGSWTETALAVLRFFARLPLAIAVVVGSVCVSWLAFWLILRVTQLLYSRFLAHRW